MLFMVAAYLKPGFEKQLINFSDELNEHFAQSNLKIAGALRDGEGQRRGYLGFVEADDIEGARRYVRQGPFYQEHLYDRIDVFQYDVEVGELA